MARITLDVDDAVLGEAAHALGTTGAEETIRAAAVRGGTGVNGTFSARRAPNGPFTPRRRGHASAAAPA